MRYTASFILAVFGLSLGIFTVWSLFFAVVWGLQLPTSETFHVQVGLALVQLVSALLGWRFATASIRANHPGFALLAGIFIGSFGMSTYIQFFGWP